MTTVEYESACSRSRRGGYKVEKNRKERETRGGSKVCVSILGTPSSGPLEPLWDAADAMDQKLEGKVEIGEGAVK